MSKLAWYFFVAFPLAAFAGPPALQKQPDAERLYGLAARESQYQSLISMPEADIAYGRYGRLRLVRGHTGIAVPGAARFKAGDSAATVFRKLKAMLLASDSDALTVRHVTNADGGGYTIFMDQSIVGLPVIDGGVNIQTNEQGEITLVSSLFIPSDRPSRTPKISAEAAQKIVAESLITSEMAVAPSVKFSDDGALGFWTNKGTAERPQLIWIIEVGYTTPKGEQDFLKFGVDAETGEVRHSERTLFGLR